MPAKERKEEVERGGERRGREGLGIEFLLRQRKEVFPSNESIRKKM